MSTERRLLETRIEERDGHTWVTGLCPACWERHAFVAPPPGEVKHVQCPEGHALAIVELTSQGDAPAEAHAH